MAAKRSKIVIYGAGAIGCALGGHLALAGVKVALIGRPGHINLIRQNGLKFVTPAGTHILKLEAATLPNQINFEPDDVVFLCTKSQDSEAALSDLNKVIKDIPIFCFQNGVRNEETATKYFRRVYGAMIRIGGEYTRHGEVTVRRDPPGWVVMGRYPEGKDALADTIAADLRSAGFSVLVSEDVMPYKWGKLVLNLNNAVGAVTNGRWEDLRAIGRAVTDEALGILTEAGIRWKSQEELGREWPELNLKPRRVLPTSEQSSTWQSLTRKQGTVETEYLNGEIVRLAKTLGKQAPINESLVRIAQEMAANHELPGKYTPEQLRKMLNVG
jgi:2-dehydropantoate 2-reductase